MIESHAVSCIIYIMKGLISNKNFFVLIQTLIISVSSRINLTAHCAPTRPRFSYPKTGQKYKKYATKKKTF